MNQTLFSHRTDSTDSLKHIGIIMDGNGRWAKSKGLKRIEGHRRGSQSVKDIIEGAMDFGVDTLTLYAFSAENWKRPSQEIKDIMNLLRYFIKTELNNLNNAGVKLNILGDISVLSKDIIKNISNALKITSNNKKLNLVVAINYGSRQEITKAIKNIVTQVKSGDIDISDISEKTISQNLDTNGTPDPDLIIRTGGEFRLSNFLLWQAAYSELIFSDIPWPDFSKKDLEAAINVYKSRIRRFGGI